VWGPSSVCGQGASSEEDDPGRKSNLRRNGWGGLHPTRTKPSLAAVGMIVEEMNIGKPAREYIVEPVEDPVPRELPVQEPVPEREVTLPEPARPGSK
jgi:hypothetical protein